MMKYKFGIEEEVKIPSYDRVGKIKSREFVLVNFRTLSFFEKIYKVEMGSLEVKFLESDLEKIAIPLYQLII